MTAISEAREAEKMVKIRFEVSKQKEWQEISANVKAAVAQAVWQAKESGMSIAQIAREYGTSDRGTIYTILKRQAEYHALVPDIEAEATPVKVVWSGEKDVWNVFVTETGEAVKVKVNSEFGAVIPVLAEGESATELHKELMAWRYGDSDVVNALIAATGLTKEDNNA